jgi:selenide,water dikinase
MEDELVSLLAGIGGVLQQCGCALVGGHTSEGLELALGLSITGYLSCDQMILPKALVIPKGDTLLTGPTGYVFVLTKALGTGTLLAADMHMSLAPTGIGCALQAAWHSMRQSNASGAAVFNKMRCIACTDVTGFGLLGHLLEMLSAGMGYGARLSMSKLPLLPGALGCVQQGILSSLQPQVLTRSAWHLLCLMCWLCCVESASRRRHRQSRRHSSLSTVSTALRSSG